jgi:hypothetical protein
MAKASHEEEGTAHVSNFKDKAKEGQGCRQPWTSPDSDYKTRWSLTLVANSMGGGIGGSMGAMGGDMRASLGGGMGAFNAPTTTSVVGRHNMR